MAELVRWTIFWTPTTLLFALRQEPLLDRYPCQERPFEIRIFENRMDCLQDGRIAGRHARFRAGHLRLQPLELQTRSSPKTQSLAQRSSVQGIELSSAARCAQCKLECQPGGDWQKVGMNKTPIRVNKLWAEARAERKGRTAGLISRLDFLILYEPGWVSNGTPKFCNVLEAAKFAMAWIGS